MIQKNGVKNGWPRWQELVRVVTRGCHVSCLTRVTSWQALVTLVLSRAFKSAKILVLSTLVLYCLNTGRKSESNTLRFFLFLTKSGDIFDPYPNFQIFLDILSLSMIQWDRLYLIKTFQKNICQDLNRFGWICVSIFTMYYCLIINWYLYSPPSLCIHLCNG